MSSAEVVDESPIARKIHQRLERYSRSLEDQKEKFEDHKEWLRSQKGTPSFKSRRSVPRGDDAFAPSPSINESSRRIVRDKPVEDVLIEKGKLAAEKKEKLRLDMYERRREEVEQAKLKHSPVARDPELEDRLYKMHFDAQKRLEQRRKEIEEEKDKEFSTSYGFKPSLDKSQGPGGVAASRKVDVLHGLEKWDQTRQKRVEEQRKQLEQEELGDVKPKPTINERSAKIVAKKRRESGSGRVEDRLLEAEMHRKLTMMEKQELLDLEQNPGHPRITEYAAGLTRDGDAFSRLYDLSFSYHEKRRMQQEREDQWLEVQRKSGRSFDAESSGSGVGEERSKPFGASMYSSRVEDELLRRAEESRLRQQMKEEEQRLADEEKRRPQINPLSEEIASRLPSTPIERLLSPRHIPHLDDPEATELTFKPRINERSREIVEQKKYSGDVYRRSRALIDHKKSHVDQLREMIVGKEMKECTFQPDTAHSKTSYSSSTHLQKAGKASFVERLMVWKNRKDERVNARREALKEKELEECSFQPETTPLRSSSASPSHLKESHGKKRQQSAERREREEERERDLEREREREREDARSPPPLASGVEEFLERQERGRVLKELRQSVPHVTGRGWKYRKTEPIEPALGTRRGDTPEVASLRKPATPPRLADLIRAEQEDVGRLRGVGSTPKHLRPGAFSSMGMSAAAKDGIGGGGGALGGADEKEDFEGFEGILQDEEDEEDRDYEAEFRKQDEDPARKLEFATPAQSSGSAADEWLRRSMEKKMAEKQRSGAARS